MQVYIGNSLKSQLITATFQNPYPEMIKCSKCKGDSQPLMIVDDPEGELSNLPVKRLNGIPIWPHDSCSFALYMCTQCGNVDTEWTQG